MVLQVNYKLICLGGASSWTHGVQFVRLAFQNSMACQIDGCTLHHWSGIKVGETGGTALTEDAHKLATKRQSLRWVLIDEVSMISAPLVAVLDILIGKVILKRDSWKRRADGTERPFGGLDVMFFGDFSDGGAQNWPGGFQESFNRQNQCSGGLQCALDRQTYWFLGLQDVLDRQR